MSSVHPITTVPAGRTTGSTNRPGRARRRSTRRVAGAFLALAMPATALAASMAPAHAQSSGSSSSGGSIERTVAVTQPATVRLEMDWHVYVDTGEADFGRVGPLDFTSSCTGFVVDPSGYIVTAGHCIDPSIESIGGDVLNAILGELVNEGYLTAAEAQSPEVQQYAIGNWSIEGEAKGSPADVDVLVGHGIGMSGKEQVDANRARVIEVNKPSKGDVALVKVEAHDLPTIQLADGGDPDVGTPILSVGYPATSDDAVDATMTATFKDGKVSSKKTRDGGALPVFEVSAAMSPGMSGGPTVTEDAKVIGLNSFYPAGENQQFNFLSPVSLIRETLNRNGVKNTPGPIDQLYRDGLDAYYAGKYKTAMDKFDQVLTRQPSHQQAQELKAKAAEKQGTNPEPAAAATPAVDTKPVESSSSSNTLLFVGLGIGAVVIIGGAVLVVSMTRKGGYGSPSAPMAPMTMAPTGPAPAPMATAPAPAPAPVTVPTNGSAPQPAPVPVTAPVEAPTATATAVLAPSFCASCGAQATPEDRFCRSCGATTQP